MKKKHTVIALIMALVMACSMVVQAGDSGHPRRAVGRTERSGEPGGTEAD